MKAIPISATDAGIPAGTDGDRPFGIRANFALELAGRRMVCIFLPITSASKRFVLSAKVASNSCRVSVPTSLTNLAYPH